MTLQVWVAFVVLETVLCLTPGPAVLYVVSTSLARGARAGLGGALGIVACNTFYFLLSALVRGFVVQASNPKALAFFVALLPQFIDAHASVPEQVAILAVTSVVIEYVVQAGYVWLATRAGALAGLGWTTQLTRVAGGLLVAAGARLAIARTV